VPNRKQKKAGGEPKTSGSSSVRLFGRARSAPAYAIRDFLHRNGVPFRWVDLNTNEQCRKVGLESPDDRRAPVCILPDGTRLENPTIRQLAEKLGWFHNPSLSEYDLAIYGAGPAGLSAAVYGASEGLKTVLIERWAVGGQAGSSPQIENYLGFPDGISGANLAERARQQALRFGAEILVARERVGGEFTAGKRIGQLADGTKIAARSAICATGVDYRRLGLPNEEQFYGAGVFYGAGASEAELCGNDRVYIVGGGNSAGQASLHFARCAARITIVIRGESLKTTLSKYLMDRIHSAKNIKILPNTEVTALHGNRVLESITLRNLLTAQEQTCKTGWLFVCIGGAPRTDWAAAAGILRDAGGYLLTGPDLPHNGNNADAWPLDRSPHYLETTVPGVFAAGDVRHGSVHRFASAVGEGAMAVMFVHSYLSHG